MGEPPKISAARIVVVMPNWLGDAVMATPFLRALRGLYPQGHIAAVARGIAVEVCHGLVDDVKVVGKKEERIVAQWMRQQRFELGVLLPNSFRSAWMLWRGGVKRRLGYTRGGRSILLTDRVHAIARSAAQLGLDQRRTAEIAAHGGGSVRVGSAYQPVPTIGYYLELARYLGAKDAGRSMALHVSEEERGAADDVLKASGVLGKDYVILVPGANFGASKCWMPERFAALADHLIKEFGVQVVIANSPAEEPLAHSIWALSQNRDAVHVLSEDAEMSGKKVSIGALKEIVRRARLMICNDTGPRHIAAAFQIPTVTLFGPTDPIWAETYSAVERIVRVEVPCGPCQLKQCPIDHRCMKSITPDMVLAAARELWDQPATSA